MLTKIYITEDCTWIFLFLDPIKHNKPQPTSWPCTQWQKSVASLDGVCVLTFTSSNQLHSFVWPSAHVAIWVCDLPCSILIKIDFYYWWAHTASHMHTIRMAQVKLFHWNFLLLWALPGQELITLCPLSFTFTLVKITLLSCFMAFNLIEGRTRGILHGFNLSSRFQHE